MIPGAMPEKLPPKFESEKYPFGCMSGYMTQLGPVSATETTTPVNGYVYKRGYGWVLHAQYPDQKEDKVDRVRKDKDQVDKFKVNRVKKFREWKPRREMR